MRGSSIEGGESNRERGSGDVGLKKKEGKVWLYQNVVFQKGGRIGLPHRPSNKRNGSCDPSLPAEAIGLLDHNERRGSTQFVLVNWFQSK